MTFDALLTQVSDLLQRQGRLSYRALKARFQLDDDLLEALEDELIYAQRVAADEDGRVVVWMGERASTTSSSPAPAGAQEREPLSYTPAHLAEKILTSRSALEGERKQVTVLFADLKGSMELLAERDPEEARQLLDPVLERMIEAVHRYEGTVNQVMGDGIMALFGAPIAHEDHAVRACYAALRMQETVTRYGDELQRSHGVSVQIRVGLHAGAVVVRAIDSSLHMDYTAVGQTTHLAARMEQMAKPGSVLTTGETLRLAAGLVQAKALGPVAVKGLADPVEVFELVGAASTRTRLQALAARGLTRFVGRQVELVGVPLAGLMALHVPNGEIFREVFALPKALAFLTPPEEELVRARFEVGGRPALVAGTGVDGGPEPDVEAFKENVEGEKAQTVRERMEEHRANPSCRSCHAVMDPLGFALENFDPVGQWRTTDADGSPLDTRGVLADGSKVDGPVALAMERAAA